MVVSDIKGSLQSYCRKRILALMFYEKGYGKTLDTTRNQYIIWVNGILIEYNRIIVIFSDVEKLQ